MDKLLCQISTVLVLIGALNWGLIGLNSEWNLVSKTTDLVVSNDKTRETVNRTVYVLVGLAAVVLIWKKLSTKHS
jgi:uncharacterized membrane protein YuzA (DUF378 family)